MPFEDMSLMRSIPTATVVDISDATLMADVFPKLVYREGVKYMRTGRKNSIKLYAPGSTFEIGKGNVLKDGTDVTIIACGIMVAKAMEAATALAEQGINAAVIDMFTVKPLDVELVTEFASKTGAVVTAENHSVNGGLTEAVARALMENKPVPAEHVAIDDRYGQVGSQDFLEKEYGLTAEHIMEVAKKAIARK
jgi:transketolase